MTARASVVVPAHDEGDGIATTLTTLLADARPDEFEVVVVCNGCSDDTADVARRVPGVLVEELPRPSKVGALRRGDQLATAFPRIYLDGDVRLTTATARALVDALQLEAPRTAGVAGRVDAADSTRLARWYYDFRQRLPVFRTGIIGAGVYAMNRAGRGRFRDWPEVLGDDQFVLRNFAAHERITVPGHQTEVPIVEDLPTVLRRQLRVRHGNRQLTRSGPGRVTMTPPRAGIRAALRSVSTTPSAWPGAVTWIIVQATVRLRVRVGPYRGDWTASRSGPLGE